MSWTPEQLAELRRLVEDRWSAGKIAQRLGKTRNAIIGKCYRINLKLNGDTRNRVKSGGRPRGTGQKLTVMMGYRRPVAQAVPANEPLNLTILEIMRGQCRWALGEGPYTFCGHATFGASPYCEAHTAIGTTPSRYRRAA